jgi:hypothetical protein
MKDKYFDPLIRLIGISTFFLLLFFLIIFVSMTVSSDLCDTVNGSVYKVLSFWGDKVICEVVNQEGMLSYMVVTK